MWVLLHVTDTLMHWAVHFAGWPTYRVSNRGKVKRFFSALQCPPNLVYTGNQRDLFSGIEWPGREAGHPPQPSAEVQDVSPVPPLLFLCMTLYSIKHNKTPSTELGETCSVQSNHRSNLYIRAFVQIYKWRKGCFCRLRECLLVFMKFDLR